MSGNPLIRVQKYNNILVVMFPGFQEVNIFVWGSSEKKVTKVTKSHINF